MYLKKKLSSSFKKLLSYEHKNINVQRNIGVFIWAPVVWRSGASCLGRIVQGASCPDTKNLFHIHSQTSTLNASDFVEDDDKNDVNDVIDEMMIWWFD